MNEITTTPKNFIIDMAAQTTAQEQLDILYKEGQISDFEWVANNPLLKFLLQTASNTSVGPITKVVDIFLSTQSAKLKEERDLQFKEILAKRIDRLEKPDVIINNLRKNLSIAKDFFETINEEMFKTNSENKRRRFANLLLTAFVEDIDWDEAIGYVRLVTIFDDLDIRILSFANTVPECKGETFEGQKAFIVKKDHSNPNGAAIIQTHFPSQPFHVLSRACTRLTSEGLLVDLGIGLMDSRAMELFKVTESGAAFLNWIAESES